jgi:hypothetical protein
MLKSARSALQTVGSFLQRRPRLAAIGTGIGVALTTTVNSYAAASPTTGIDYVAGLVTPVKDELTLAIGAGLAILVVIMAVKAGVRLIRSFGR